MTQGRNVWICVLNGDSGQNDLHDGRYLIFSFEINFLSIAAGSNHLLRGLLCSSSEITIILPLISEATLVGL